MKLNELNEKAAPKQKGLGLSLTKIKMFDTCAYRYYLQYIKKEKFDRKESNQKFFKLGQFAHKYIESKIKGVECKFNSTTMSSEEQQEVEKNCQNVFKNSYITDLLNKDPKVEEGFSLYISIDEEDGLIAEKKVSRKADFSGYIDFFVIDKGVAHIIDWKTGSVKKEDDETFMQLYLYAKAVEKLYNINKFKISFFYIDHNKIHSKELNIKELNSKIQNVITKGVNIPQTDNPEKFPPKVGNACKFCPYSKKRSDGIIPCHFIN